MRVTQAALDAERERARLEAAGEWFPTRWYRVIEDGKVVMETSDPEEAYHGVVCDDEGNRQPHEPGHQVQRLYERHKREWRDA